MQEWSNLTRDDLWRLRKTPPFVSFLAGWLVGWFFVDIYPENGNCNISPKT
jgi:hypothetical protein